MDQNSIIFSLSSKLQYSKNGDFEETASVELMAPSFDTMEHSLKLSQYTMKAMMQASKNLSDDERKEQLKKAEEHKKEGKKDEPIDAKAVYAFLLSSEIDIMTVVRAFIKMATEVGFLDEDKKAKLKENHFRKLNINDTVNMMCEYIAVFCQPSS